MSITRPRGRVRSGATTSSADPPSRSGTDGERVGAVDLRGLTVRRGKSEVLQDVSLSIPTGAITGLLGPSGCGKTTLLRSIVGTQIVRSGSVSVFGLPAGSRGLRNRIGYVTQSPSIYGDLTVHENVAYFAALAGADRTTVSRTLESVGLDRYATQHAQDLSGGQRTRTSLACALVARPDLLVLDEPTVGLDPVLRSELWERFAALAAAGTTLIVSSHVMDEADHCDELILLRDGRLLAQSTPAALRRATGEESLEDVFLSLVRGGGEPGRHGDAAAAR